MRLVLLPLVLLSIVLALNRIALVAHRLLGDRLQLHKQQSMCGWLRLLEIQYSACHESSYLNVALKSEDLALQIFYLTHHLLHAECEHDIARQHSIKASLHAQYTFVLVLFLLQLARQIPVLASLLLHLALDPVQLVLQRLLRLQKDSVRIEEWTAP